MAIVWRAPSLWFRKTPAGACDICGKAIGTENWLEAWDGIKNKKVTLHKRCHDKSVYGRDPDLQRHFHATLAPAVFDVTGQGIK